MRLALLSHLDPFERIMFAVLCFVIVFLFAPVAFAQTATPVASTFDFGPLAYAVVEFVAPIVVSIFGPLGVWVLARVLKFLGLKQDALQRAAIEQGMDRAIGFAMSRLGDRAAGGIPIAVKADAVRVAAQYAEANIPAALKYFKKDGDAIASMVEARLDSWLVDPDASKDGATVGRALLRSAITIA